MAKQLQLRRGTTAQHSTFTGAVGEITVDTDKDVVVVHDGSTAGGFPLARADGVVATATTANALNTSNAYTGTSFNSITGLSSTTPIVAGTAAVGTATTAARADHVHPAQTTITGNAATATKLATARTINGVSFDGTANITVADSTKVDKVTSTDNAIARYDGTGGAIQNSSVVIDDSGNVGIGTSSPDRKLTIEGDIRVRSGSAILINNPANNYSFGMNLDSNNNMGFNGQVTVTQSGNVGIGVTPSAWSAGKALEIGGFGNGLFYSGSNNFRLTSNAYYNSGYKYGQDGTATMYEFDAGSHKWHTAPSGTAGNAITWTNAMTLNPNGNLLVGTTTDNGVDKLQVNGTVRIKGSTYGENYIVKDVTSGACYFTQSELNVNNYGDNQSYFIFITVFRPTSDVSMDVGSMIVHGVMPRGGNSIFSTISTLKGPGITTLTASLYQTNTLKITTDADVALKIGLKVITIGGTGI